MKGNIQTKQSKKRYLQLCLLEDITPHVSIIGMFRVAGQDPQRYIQMNLSEQGLSDSDISPFLKAISADPYITSVNLSCNSLEQVTGFFDLITEHNSITSLILSKNKFNLKHIQKLRDFTKLSQKNIDIKTEAQSAQSAPIKPPPSLREQVLEKIQQVKQSLTNPSTKQCFSSNPQQEREVTDIKDNKLFTSSTDSTQSSTIVPQNTSSKFSLYDSNEQFNHSVIGQINLKTPEKQNRGIPLKKTLNNQSSTCLTERSLSPFLDCVNKNSIQKTQQKNEHGNINILNSPSQVRSFQAEAAEYQGRNNKLAQQQIGQLSSRQTQISVENRSNSKTHENNKKENENKEAKKLIMSRMNWLLEIRVLFEKIEKEGKVNVQNLIQEILKQQHKIKQLVQQEDYASKNSSEVGLSLRDILRELRYYKLKAISIDDIFDLVSNIVPDQQKLKRCVNVFQQGDKSYQDIEKIRKQINSGINLKPSTLSTSIQVAINESFPEHSIFQQQNSKRMKETKNQMNSLQNEQKIRSPSSNQNTKSFERIQKQEDLNDFSTIRNLNKKRDEGKQQNQYSCSPLKSSTKTTTSSELIENDKLKRTKISPLPPKIPAKLFSSGHFASPPNVKKSPNKSLSSGGFKEQLNGDNLKENSCGEIKEQQQQHCNQKVNSLIDSNFKSVSDYNSTQKSQSERDHKSDSLSNYNDCQHILSQISLGSAGKQQYETSSDMLNSSKCYKMMEQRQQKINTKLEDKQQSPISKHLKQREPEFQSFKKFQQNYYQQQQMIHKNNQSSLENSLKTTRHERQEIDNRENNQIKLEQSSHKVSSGLNRVNSNQSFHQNEALIDGINKNMKQNSSDMNSFLKNHSSLKQQLSQLGFCPSPQPQQQKQKNSVENDDDFLSCKQIPLNYYPEQSHLNSKIIKQNNDIQDISNHHQSKKIILGGYEKDTQNWANINHKDNYQHQTTSEKGITNPHFYQQQLFSSEVAQEKNTVREEKRNYINPIFRNDLRQISTPEKDIKDFSIGEEERIELTFSSKAMKKIMKKRNKECGQKDSESGRISLFSFNNDSEYKNNHTHDLSEKKNANIQENMRNNFTESQSNFLNKDLRNFKGFASENFNNQDSDLSKNSNQQIFLKFREVVERIKEQMNRLDRTEGEKNLLKQCENFILYDTNIYAAIFENIRPTQQQIELLKQTFMKEYFNLAQAIKISFSPLEQLPINTFIHNNLKILNISFNDLKSLQWLSSYQLISLEFLNISFNNLESLEGINNLKNLKELHGGMNQIKCISSQQIQYLNTSLTLIDLSNNKISSLKDLSSLQTLQSLKILFCEVNPICQNPNYQHQLQQLLPKVQLLIDDECTEEINSLCKFSSFKQFSQISFADENQLQVFHMKSILQKAINTNQMIFPSAPTPQYVNAPNYENNYQLLNNKEKKKDFNTIKSINIPFSTCNNDNYKSQAVKVNSNNSQLDKIDQIKNQCSFQPLQLLPESCQQQFQNLGEDEQDEEEASSFVMNARKHIEAIQGKQQQKQYQFPSNKTQQFLLNNGMTKFQDENIDSSNFQKKNLQFEQGKRKQ